MRNKFLIFINLLITNFIFAQLLELPKSILSPNAASLGKYGDISMDLNTGRANVNIPLYSLNEGGIPLDISLNYDTGGVRVSDVPGWVGQNWTLNAGGVITRTVKGTTYDEQKFDAPNPYPGGGQKGYFYHTEKLNRADWNSSSYLTQLAIESAEIGTTKFSHDLEPDIFTFNFMGYTGKFFLGEDGKWKVSSNDNIKVIIDMTDNVIPMNFPSAGYNESGNPDPMKFPKSIGKITLIDGAGNKYVFGGVMNAIEFSNYDFFEQSSTGMFATSWYLTSVYNHFNQQLYSFEYERGYYQAAFYNYNIYEDFYKSSNGAFVPNCSRSYKPNPSFAGGQLIIPSYLKKIIGLKSNVNIDFFSSERQALSYSLNDISIVNAYNKWKLEHPENYAVPFSTWCIYGFYYLTRKQDGITTDYPALGFDFYTADWFLSRLKWRKLDLINISSTNLNRNITFNYTDNFSQRLKLDGVIIDGQQKYLFGYNNFESLPNTYLNHLIDHFGYYKGTEFNNDPIYHYSSRETNPVTLQYGSLNKLIYPTGGFTEFQYEPHTYSKSIGSDLSLLNEIGIISGLRVKKIIDFSDAINKTEKEYLYSTDIDNQTSSGILLQKIQYYFPNWKMKTTGGAIYTKNMFSINSLIPLSNFSGSQIEYSTVIVREIGKGYIKNSYKTHQDYPNSYSGTISPEHSIFDPKTDMSYKSGKLYLTEYYDELGEELKSVDYLFAETSPQKIRAFSYGNFLPCPGVMDGILTGNAYEIYYSDNNLIQKKTKTYGDNGQVLEEVENYNYITKENFGDIFLRNRSTITTDGKTLREEYKYTFDKTGIEPYTSLTNRREYSIVETNKTLNTEKISSTKVDYLSMPIYNNNGSSTTATQLFPQKYSEAKGNNALEEKLMVDKYDVDGNILLAHKTNGTYIYYFYAYNNRYPIMKIEGAQSSGTGYTFDYFASQLRTLVEAAKPNMSQIINKQVNIINYYPNHQITFYTYKPNFGVNSITSPNGMVEYYNYDSLGRLINITDQNGKVLKDYYYQIQN